jgi:uncharacterized protein
VKFAVTSVLALLLATGTAFAQESTTVAPEFKASDESIHHLLDVMQSKKMVEAMSQQVDSMYAGMVGKILEGKDLTPEQQQQIQARREKARDLFKQMFSWDSMERFYMKVYGETFTQSEVDGMTAFYSSPAGQAVIVKLPLAMRNSMAMMQERMQSLVPQLQQMAKETAEQIKAGDTGTAKRKAG